MKLFPERMYASVDEVPFESEYGAGVRGIIFDIDNTLVPHGAPADAHAESLFAKLRMLGFRFCLISNNHEARVRPFAERVNALFECDAGKPLRRGYLRAMELMGTTQKETLFIGDQILTDVWGANRVGIRSFLIYPVARHTDPLQVRLKRLLEIPVLYFFRRRQRRRGRINT